MQKVAQYNVSDSTVSIFIGLAEGSDEFGKVREKNDLCSIVQTVTGDINYNFSDVERQKSK
jgi:hypothetical protein